MAAVKMPAGNCIRNRLTALLVISILTAGFYFFPIVSNRQSFLQPSFAGDGSTHPWYSIPLCQDPKLFHATVDLMSYSQGLKFLDNVREVNRGSFLNFPKFTFLSMDAHIGPISDTKYVLEELGIRVLDRSLSGHCRFRNTCHNSSIPHPLSILGYSKNGYIEYGRKLYEAHKNDVQIQKVDAVLCFFPPSGCEVWKAFNKSLFVDAAFRFVGVDRDITKERAEDLKLSIVNLTRSKRNFLASTNMYDAEYLRHFTNLNVFPLLSTGQYLAKYFTPFKYAPKTKSNIVIAPQRLSEGGVRIAETLIEHARVAAPKISLSHWFGIEDQERMKSVSAFVAIPYSAHSFGLVELKGMGVPVFFPSKRLLAAWIVDFTVMPERHHIVKRSNSSLLDPSPNSPHKSYDPGNDNDYASVYHWIQFCDWYFWPVGFFDSWDDLLFKLENANFELMAEKMRVFNNAHFEQAKLQWRCLISRKLRNILPGESSIPNSYEEGLALYEQETRLGGDMRT